MRNKFLVIVAVFALGTFANAQVLDHITGGTGADLVGLNAAQDFSPANSALDVQVLEDFTVTGSQLTVTTIEVLMGGFAGFLNGMFTDGTVTNYHVNIYSSPNAAGALNQGDIYAQTFAPGSMTISGPMGFAETSVLGATINFTLPAAGTYWASIQPEMNFSPFGQTGVVRWAAGTFNGGSNAIQANPNGGFFGPPGWIDIGADVAYRVNAVPEPASMIALGLGVAALVARRRRKKLA
ncbi:MAG: PEP-CTERM sorting domain-containing protein [Armatimonadetes bacterium]|nr:PEP-CTERM sorting domain-containing protein [Armatimonadota bacterium]